MWEANILQKKASPLNSPFSEELAISYQNYE